MKKFLISAAFIIGFGSYAVYSYLANNSNAQAQVTTPVDVADTAQPAATPTTTAATAAGSAPPTANSSASKSGTKNSSPSMPSTRVIPKGKFADGTYTGPIEDAYYGNVQVRATVSSGRLVGVTFIQYPNDRSTSRYINQQAMPTLIAEAIQAQSAQVDDVSGASDTSAAFKQSLAAALQRAQA